MSQVQRQALFCAEPRGSGGDARLPRLAVWVNVRGGVIQALLGKLVELVCVFEIEGTGGDVRLKKENFEEKPKIINKKTSQCGGGA